MLLQLYGYPFLRGGEPGAEDPASYPEQDPVERLLAALSVPSPEPPQQIGTGRRVLGSIGDALLAMAAVKAGGAPPAMGPFAANQLAQKQRYQESLMEAGRENRETQRRVRIGAFEEGQRLKREKEVAGVRQKSFRPQLKTFRTKNKAGQPVEVPYLFDPNRSTLEPVQGHEGGFEQYVRPFLAQGINQETGQLEYRLVDPFPESGGQGSAAQGQPGTTDASVTVPGFEPKPTAGEAESVEAVSVIGNQLAEFKKLSGAFSGRKRTLGLVRSLGQGVVRELPGGQQLSETLGDPLFEQLSALRDRIGQQLARLVESGRLSDQDRDFALRNLPTVAALTTDDGRKTAAAKIEIVEAEIMARLARKRTLRPALTSPGSTATSVDSIIKQYEKEYGGANPTP